MATRLSIVDMAIWESNYGSWKPSGAEMVEIFQTAGLQSPTTKI